MPFRSNKRRSRRTAGGAPWYSKKYSATQLAAKAWKGVKFIKGIVNAELKFHDKSEELDTAGWDGANKHLSDVAQGDTAVTRDGNSIFAKAIYGTLYISKHASATNTAFRLIVYIDTDDVGSTGVISASALLQVTGSAEVICAPINQNYTSRVVKLYDRIVRLTADNPTAIVKFYKRLRHHFKFTSASASDTTKQSLRMTLYSTEETNVPHVVYETRLRYYDN